MILGLDVLGSSFIENIVPSRQSFNKLVIFGEGTVDEIHIRNYEMEDNDILALNSEEVFDSRSLMLAHCNGNLISSNYISISAPIYSYLVEKKLAGTSQYQLIKEILDSDNITTVKDYFCKNYENYEYAVFPKDVNGVVGSSDPQSTSSNFYGWFLISQDQNQVYKFDTNIQSDPFVIQEDYHIFNNYSQYTVVNQGKRKYKMGKLTTLPYYWNNQEFIVDADLLEEIKNFINDGNPKYLKNTSGELYLCSTHNFSFQYMDNIPQQPYTITFEIVEIGSV